MLMIIVFDSEENKDGHTNVTGWLKMLTGIFKGWARIGRARESVLREINRATSFLPPT